MPTNTSPVLSGLGDTASYNENAAAIILDTNGDASVSDAELDTFPSYAGATLTLARQGGANSDDFFSGNGTAVGKLDLTHGNELGENVSLDGGASFIGTFSQFGDGTFTVTFNSNASHANVNSVLQQISYANTSDNPPASVTIDFTFNDGNGLPGGQDQGTGSGSTTGSVTVNIAQIDDVPLLISVAPSSAYAIATPGAVLSPGLGVFDADATPPSPLTGLINATVQITSGFLAGDQLFVNLATDANTGHFTTPDGDITGISASYSSGTLTLSGASTTQDYRAVLDAVSYMSTVTDPTNGGANLHRTITWTVNDGSLSSQTPNTDPNNLVNTTILNFASTPVLDLDASGAGTGFTTSFTENGAPIGIVDTDVSLSYPGSTTVDLATVVLTNAAGSDSLSVAGALPGGIGSTIDSSVAGQITLTLFGSASLADYRTSLGLVRFVNSSDNPSTTDRDISVLVSAGEVFSNTAHATVHVIALNDAPVITSDGGGDTAAVSVAENTTAVTTVIAADPDSSSLTYSIIGGSDAGKFQINASSGALSFIAAPDFEIPGDSDHNNTYVVQVQASDGSLTDTQTITVGVTNVNDPVPTLHWSRSVDIGAHPAGWLPSGIGDFNGDGNSDLAWFNSTTGNIDIWKLANGQWAGSSNVGNHPAGYQPSGVGDFNHDGTGDILWFNSSTHDAEIWKISNAQWAGSVDIGVHPGAYAPSGVGDFNNDGTSDVLWYNASTHDAEIWKTSNGQWAGSVDIGVHPAGYTPALTGDFNGDGTSDVAWFNASTGDVDIWKIANGQWAGSSSVGAHPLGWQPLGAADFNLDGTSDIAWYNPTTNDVEVWLIKNAQWAGSVDIGTHPAGSVAVGVGDFDHNGVSDILWRNPSDGHVESWMLAFS